MTKPRPQWLIPLVDGLPPITVTIDDGLHPPAVHIDWAAERPRIATPLEAAQLGQALQDASREAAQLATKARKR